MRLNLAMLENLFAGVASILSGKEDSNRERL